MTTTTSPLTTLAELPTDTLPVSVLTHVPEQTPPRRQNTAPMSVLTFASGLAGDPGFHVFLGSVARHLPDASLIVLSPDRLELPSSVRLVSCAVGPGKPILTRWQAIAAQLRVMSARDMVLLADSRDLVFNADPRPRIAEVLGDHDILFFSEHQTTGDHDWCRKQAAMLQEYSASPHALDQPEINGGVIAGRAGALAAFAEDIAFAMGLFTKTALSDQPVINRWARARNVCAASPAVSGSDETAGDGPQAHPERGLRCALATDRALYCHGELVRAKRWSGPAPETCAIFHQFDRVPAFRAKYGAAYPMAATAVGKQLVVSHYNEDLAWTGNLFPELPLLVYSKAEAPASAPVGAVRLPNVGFEAQTWLHHFAANYDALPKVTVVMQGHPGAHFKREDKVVRDAILGIDPDDFSFMPIAGLGHASWQRRDGSPDHIAAKGREPIGPDMDRLWRELLGCPPPQLWFCWYGGQFAVHRDLVRRRPREFWTRAAALVQTKNEACVLERMWGHLFS